MLSFRQIASSAIIGLSVLGSSSIELGQKAFAAPAPPLTALRVTGVYSDMGSVSGNGGWEYPIPMTSSISTQYSHYGNVIGVYVCETGYGQNSIAKFNGNPMKLDRSDPQPDSSGTITGYCRLWEYDNSFNGGTFTYQASSINAPFRTLSLSFYVRAQ
ncbi:MAG: DUF4879 domain-containing protein [Rhizonema sp. NSF051]|nr:DUF4879 domain-containing protein [Rhizonema sp. NSF051]